MIIAVLFNSDHPSLGSYYGWPIQQKILESHILQDSERHLKVGMGDLLFLNHSKTIYDIRVLAQKTFFHYETNRLNIERINACVTNATIFAWVIQNVTEDLAEQLHQSLLAFPSYLGIHSVNFSYEYHLVFYRNYIGEKYRMIGSTIRVFCPMGELEEYDAEAFEELKTLGFDDIALEDSGAKLTIFDNYDTQEHFQQVNDFVIQVSPYFKNGESDAYELCMLLSDMNPKLFHSLGAAVRAIRRMKNEEDVAQAALSGRRYLEQLADVLFAPSEEKHNGRKVRKAEYKNRIWTFIEDSAGENTAQTLKLGKEVDRLVELFNTAIHGEQSKDIRGRKNFCVYGK